MKFRNKIFFLIFLAILIRLIIFGVSIYSNGYDNFINKVVLLPGNDPYTYNQLALNFIKHNSFSYEAGLPPISLRTPGYPFIISIIYNFFGANPINVLFFQILLDSLNVLLIYLIANYFFNQRISLIAAFLYSIEPHASVFSLSLYSDTVFVFFFTLFSYLFIKSIYTGENKLIIISGIILGISNLIKPSGIFISIIILLILFFKYRTELKKFFIKSILFSLFFMITLSPWLIRNYLYFNKVFLSTAGEYNLLVLNVAPIKMSHLKIQQDEAIYQLLAEADSLMKMDNIKPLFTKEPSNYWEELTLQYDFNKAPYWKKLALHYISEYPMDFIKFYLLGIFHSFANLGTGTYSVYFNLNKKVSNFNIKSEKNFLMLVKKFFESKNISEILLAAIISIYLLIVYSGLIIGIIKFNYWNYENKYLNYFILSIIIYFVLISGAGGLARFKLPAIPLYLAISSFGINFVLSNLKNYKKFNKFFRKMT